MSPRIALITDSTCDLPQEYLDQYHIQVVPLTIIWDGQEYLDGVDLKAEDFYRRLEGSPTIPTTSQPTPESFYQAYKQAREQGAESALVITISSAMSGTYASAQNAAGMIDIPVEVLDSKSNSMSLGWQVLAAARAREGGGGLQEMIQAADQARQSMVFLITLDTLEYLYKGGRIGGASHFIGNLLDLKPQIYVNHQTGEVEGGRRSRTRRKALQDLFTDFFSRIDPEQELRVAVLHNAAIEEAQALASRIEDELHPAELIISIVSPVLGVHTGPRAVAICGYTI
ncbi:MAG: DegV family protein [Anaerolineales bacterium]